MLKEFVENKDIVVLDVDLGKVIKSILFKEVVLDRFFDMGIVEGDMIGIVVGFVICGKIFFVSIFVIFVVGRGYE